MKYKVIIIILGSLLSNHSYSSEHKVIFTNYMITNNATVDKVDKYIMEKESITIFTDDDIKLIEQYSSFQDECSAVTSMGRIDVDTLRPIPYAKQIGDKYVIENSDRFAGLQCSLNVVDKGYALFLDGKFQFYSLVERRSFNPFPPLDGGEPLVVTGGRNTDLKLMPEMSTLGSYILVGKAGGTEKTLSLMMIRFEPVADD